ALAGPTEAGADAPEGVEDAVGAGAAHPPPGAARRPTKELPPLPPTFPLPDTVEEGLLARLAGLDAAAQPGIPLAAVLGNSIPRAVVRGLVPEDMGDAELAAILAGLVRADLLRPEPAGPDPGYSFKHNLTRQAAYESLAYAERSRLHGEAGALLEHLYGP